MQLCSAERVRSGGEPRNRWRGTSTVRAAMGLSLVVVMTVLSWSGVLSPAGASPAAAATKVTAVTVAINAPSRNLSSDLRHFLFS